MQPCKRIKINNDAYTIEIVIEQKMLKSNNTSFVADLEESPLSFQDLWFLEPAVYERKYKVN